MFKSIVTVILASMLLIGCAAQEDVNRMISENNQASREHMATALSNAKTSEAVLAMSILFAVGAGQQDLYRERDAVDYMNASFNWVQLLSKGWNFGTQDASVSYHAEGQSSVYVTNTRSSNNTATADSWNDKDSYNDIVGGDVTSGATE